MYKAKSLVKQIPESKLNHLIEMFIGGTLVEMGPYGHLADFRNEHLSFQLPKG